MASCRSFAGPLLLCERDWLMGRIPSGTSFDVGLPSGAGGGGYDLACYRSIIVFTVGGSCAAAAEHTHLV